MASDRREPPPLASGEEPRLFLLRLAGDLYTKARPTRSRFLRRLERNLADALRTNGIEGTVVVGWSRAEVRAREPETAEVLARVFGVQSVSEAIRRPWGDLADLAPAAVELFADAVAGGTFAVRARRLGDRGRIPFTSQQVEIEIGRVLRPFAAGVDLRRPDHEVHVEVEPGRASFFRAKARGPGGLPLGTGGRAVALVSGGLDSAVAAWLLLRRGVELDYLFANLAPGPDAEAHRETVHRVLAILGERYSFGGRPRLHEVDFSPLATAIQSHARTYHAQVLLKRYLLRAAEAIARESGASAIATGDAIAQVSSQTLRNLEVVSEATRLLVLRPLVAQGKEEIAALGREIGVALPAAAVVERCDLAGRRPATRARLDRIREDEARIDATLLAVALRTRRTTDLRALSRELASRPEIEPPPPPELPELMLDLRPKSAFDAWHAPGALRLDFDRALEAYPSFARDRAYVVVCELGWKSALLAREMRQAGLLARPYPGGLRALARDASRGDFHTGG